MAAADLNSVRSTIEGRLATELADTSGDKVAIPVAFHNMPYEPTPGSSWASPGTDRRRRPSGYGQGICGNRGKPELVSPSPLSPPASMTLIR